MNNTEKIHHSLRNFLIVIIELFLHKQVPESPVAKARKLFIARREPYQDCEERTRRDIRRELAAAIGSEWGYKLIAESISPKILTDY